MEPAHYPMSDLELPASMAGHMHDDVVRGVPGGVLLPQQRPRDALPVHPGPHPVDQERHQTLVQVTGKLLLTCRTDGGFSYFCVWTN